MIRINLISGPRNISTALMYSFAQRSDTNVLDEPFYAVYLTKSGANHPGKSEVLKSQSSQEREVWTYIKSLTGKPVLFIKNMAHHMEILEHNFYSAARHVFLIRDPRQIIASYAQVIERPVMRDIGIEYQYTLFEKLRAQGEHPVVVDSGTLLASPNLVLTKLCSALGITFDQRMLHWSAGPKVYDGVWAPHWYANVHQSTGFEKQATSNRSLPAHLYELYDAANSFYQKLLPFSLKA